jgi:hypothetical protein
MIAVMITECPLIQIYSWLHILAMPNRLRTSTRDHYGALQQVRYNPATNRWSALPESPLHGRQFPTAVWTGRQMIVWGGFIPRKNTPRTFPDGQHSDHAHHDIAPAPTWVCRICQLAGRWCASRPGLPCSGALMLAPRATSRPSRAAEQLSHHLVMGASASPADSDPLAVRYRARPGRCPTALSCRHRTRLPGHRDATG